MPYVQEKLDVNKSIRVEEFLLEKTKLSISFITSLLDKGKILDHNEKRLKKGYKLKEGYITIYLFKEVSRGLKPLFETQHFAIFDKPSGILVHPTSIHSGYTLLDEIKHYLGAEASLVHRIDKETSGLVLVSKNPYSQMILKNMFEERKYIKIYKALVDGEIKDELTINKKITNSKGKIKIKMVTSEKGKESKTFVKPIHFDKNQNQTLIEVIPYTGRQHQIRVHLESINHAIIGDPIYAISEEFTDDFLNKKVSLKDREKTTKAKRLMLHANSLEFTFLGIKYKLCSKQDIFKKEST